jgi:hypothetical protein
MRFDTWTVRSLYKAGSLKTVSRELNKYKLDLVRVQEVRWEAVAPNLRENTHFSMEMEMRIMNWVHVFLCA